MRSSTALAVLPVLAASVSAQQTFQVQVGANGGLTYNPPTVTANVGDTISFLFMAKNHTVTQSTFAAPCQNMTTPTVGIDSGFQPVAAGATSVPSLSITVNDTTPLWFYCRQSGHCQKGMVFAVNPTAEKSYSAFQAAANASSPTDGSPASAAPASSGAATSSIPGSAAPASSAAPGAAPANPPADSSPTDSSTPSSSSTSSATSSTVSAAPNGAAVHSVGAGALLAAAGFAMGLVL